MILELVPDSNTTNIRPTATFWERACRIWGVDNKFLKPIRNHLRVKNTDMEQASSNLHALIRYQAILLWNLHRCHSDPQFGFQFFGVSTQGRLRNQLRNSSNFNRLGLAVMANFFLENILRQSIIRFGGKPPGFFYDVAKMAIKLAGLSNPKSHSNSLTVVLKIRNTLHVGGKYPGHKDQNSIFDLEGIRYSFIHGKIVRGCVTWDHIAHGLACGLKSVKEIVDKLPP